MVETGHIDINTTLSLLSPYLVIPRWVHLQAAIHVMSYLKLTHNLQLAILQSILTHIIIIFWNVIGQIFMRMQQNLSHPILHDLEVKGWIYIFSWTVIMLVTSGLKNLDKVHDVHEFVINYLVLNAVVYQRDISVWCRFCCHEVDVDTLHAANTS